MRRRVIERAAAGELDAEFLEAVQARMGLEDEIEKVVVYGRDDHGRPYKFILKPAKV